jgi:hypothetical protein
MPLGHVQRLDRRTWQLFNGYLDGPYQDLQVRFGTYMTAALTEASGNDDQQIAQAFARIERQEPELLRACELLRLRARTFALVLEMGAWPDEAQSDATQEGH